jgi:hypothetical protein
MRVRDQPDRRCGCWQPCWSKPLVDGCDQHGCLVTDGELVATARWRSSRLIPHSTVWRSLRPALSNLGGRPPREPSFLRLRTWSDFSGMVHALVCAGRRGSRACRRPYRHGPGRAWCGAGPGRCGAPGALQHRLKLRAVAPLAPGVEQGQRPLPLLDSEVQRGGQSAARASEAVVVGLSVNATRRLTGSIRSPDEGCRC